MKGLETIDGEAKLVVRFNFTRHDRICRRAWGGGGRWFESSRPDFNETSENPAETSIFVTCQRLAVRLVFQRAKRYLPFWHSKTGVRTMPRLTKCLPKYRKHKASAQAVVTIQGRDHYLGPHGTKASKVEYDRLTGEWMAAGRPNHATSTQCEITISEMCAGYWRHAKSYYVRDGKPTPAATNLRPTLRLMRQCYGKQKAVEFGPLALKAVAAKFIEQGHSRTYVNMNLARIRRMFKWAASEQLVPSETYRDLTTVDGLRKGHTNARESEPVTPIDDEIVQKTLTHLPRVVADMVRFQRLAGCRPGEARMLRPCNVDTSGDVWRYVPESHKTEHHDKQRVIFIGPKAQDVLRPYLLRPSESRCFSPTDSEKKRRQVHERRVTPMSCGNKSGSSRKPKTKRKVGDMYTKDSYCRAIKRACDKAFPAPEPLCQREGESQRALQLRLTPSQISELKEWQKRHHWAPNQIRHTAGTEIRKRFGLEAAQVTLGHSNADVTQIYAERDMEKAAAIMLEVG
jgi:integrase